MMRGLWNAARAIIDTIRYGQQPTRNDNVAAPVQDEEVRQRILRTVARQTFGCDVAVYKHQRTGGHVEYVIVLLEDTPATWPGDGVAPS